MHFFSDCHSASARCTKIVEVVFSKKRDFLFAKPDVRPRKIERRVSKRKKWEDFNIEAIFADAEGNTPTIF